MARRGHNPEEPTVVPEGALPPPLKTRRRPTSTRETVLAAFADLEDRLAGLGLTRKPWEAPEIYLTRAMPYAWGSSFAARRLAELYSLARYSHHPIDGPEAEAAVAASEELSASCDAPQEGTS
ncbi:MAG: DUF4129 domain-containing protein [Candidatus Dormibacteria bacterium]